MMDEKNELVKRPIHILVTNEDMYGTDITKMSNFFDLYIQDLAHDVTTMPGMNIMHNMPVADLEILNEVIQQVDVILHGGVEYIPDFDSLPKDIREKIRKGIYKIGESKQVDGNLRAVIVDENKVRVKDITLKEVAKSIDTLDATRNIVNLLQMRQIYTKLVDIQEMQSYQIDRDRDRDIITPFLNARNHILRAQNAETIEKRNTLLEKATDELDKSINSVYTDIRTTSKHLADQTLRPIFGITKQIGNYMNYITRDMQIITKIVGVQMQVFNYLERPSDAKMVLDNFQYEMTSFVSEGINKQGQSIARLMQSYYPYTENNKDCWYHFSSELSKVFEERKIALEKQKVYVVSLEDIKDKETKKCLWCKRIIPEGQKTKIGLCPRCCSQGGNRGLGSIILAGTVSPFAIKQIKNNGK